MSVLAIDHGTSKCGLAIEIAGVALPLKTIATKELISELKTLIPTRKVDTVVIGIARHLNGKVSRQSNIQKSFSQQIASQFPACEIILWDERLTTSEARLSLEEA
jgi:putative holliday junction resolvase